MNRKYAIYKGLQRPLEYKGFHGRYIYWALGCIILGLILAVVASMLFNFYVSAATLLFFILGGIPYILSKQKSGQYAKTEHKGLYVFNNNMRIRYEKPKKINI